MGTCELCGSQTEKLFAIRVAGTDMKVCSNCRSMGKSLETAPSKMHTFRHNVKNQKIEEVVSDYVKIVSSAISKRGLNLHQLARAVNIKESTLNKYMTSKLKPDVADAKKLEKFLEINIIEEVENSSSYEDLLVDEKESSAGSTLGDLLEKQLKELKK